MSDVTLKDVRGRKESKPVVAPASLSLPVHMLAKKTFTHPDVVGGQAFRGTGFDVMSVQAAQDFAIRNLAEYSSKPKGVMAAPKEMKVEAPVEVKVNRKPLVVKQKPGRKPKKK